MKVVLYSRTSTKKQNINEQLLSLVKICDDNDWDISKSFKDYGISGLVSEREGLSDLINFCLNNKVDKVLVTELSRLSRDKEQLKELISTLYEVGTSIYFSGLKIETLINNNINQNKETSLFSLVNPPNIINKTQDKRISDEWLNAQIDKYYHKEKDDPEARKMRFDDLKSTYEFYIEMEKKQRKKKKGSSGGMYYGCYVKDIKSNEIMSVKEFYQEKAPQNF